MNNIYNSYFFNEFYQENGGGNYTDEKFWTPFFDVIADKIVDIFDPKFVLDAGCACGYLVAALRDKGVQAFGIDISEYAINKVREDIKSYVNVQSITEKLPEHFPKKFDLVITIEVLEHLFPEEGKKAIELLCSYSDTVIFTSTPTDIEDKTHVNVQQKEYWAKIFAEQSFYRDLYQPVDFICAWAMLFRKRADISKVIFEYELSNRVDELKRKETKEESQELFKCYYQLDGMNSYSEEYCENIYYTSEQQKFEVEIKENQKITALRIDPMECNCIITNFHIYDLLDSGNELQIKNMNGIISRDKIIFSSKDPILEIEVPNNNGIVRLEVSYQVEYSNSQQISDTFYMISRERKDVNRLHEEYNTITEELKDDANNLRNMYEVLEKEKQNVELQMKECKWEQEKEMAMLTEELSQKLDNYKEEYKKIREIYEGNIQKLGSQCEVLEKEKKEALLEQMKYFKEKEILGVRLEYVTIQKNELEEKFQVEQNKYFEEKEALISELEEVKEKISKNVIEYQFEKIQICNENEKLKLNQEILVRQKDELEEKFQVQQVKYEKEKEELELNLEKTIEQIKKLEEKFQVQQYKFTEENNELKQKIEIFEKQTEENERKFQQKQFGINKEKEELKKKLEESYKQKEEREQELRKEIVNKETNLESLNKEYLESVKQKDEIQKQLEYYTLHYHTAINQREELQMQLNYYMLHYQTAINQREDLIVQNKEILRQKEDFEINYNNALNSYLTVIDSTCWKITSPLRKIMDFIRGTEQDKEIISSVLLFQPEELERQRKEIFHKDTKFSVLVPLYNTPINFLKEMINSVINQTYANWELCLADGSDNEHKNVKSEVLKLAKKDKRIKYKKLKENKGISENTNECIEMATGDYIALFDHDDVLHPSALYEVMKVICDKDADFIYTDENTFSGKIEDAYWPHFKPGYSPDTLRSYNYICHLTVFDKVLLEKAGGGFRKEFDGSQDYDMVLRLTEVARNIVHIPKVLYYWRAHKNSVASDISAKPYTLIAAKKALAEHLNRVGLKGEVSDARIPSTYQIKYEIIGKPLISIIIPNKDHIDDLDKCIQSVEKQSTYRHFEIIVVENNSTESETMEYYRKIQRKYKNIKVVTWREGFNYSKINNFGFKYAKGEYIVLLNNDIEIITPDWLEQMLMYTQRKDVGATGMMLYYPDDTIQHAGVILGIGGVAGHSHKYFKRGEYGYASRLAIVQNLSAVTAASMMIRADVFKQIGGLDEEFAVAFNDVDLCMKIREAGYLIVWTPYAEAYHYESKSRGFEDTPEKQQRFAKEIQCFMDKWGEVLEEGDPYYNVNLSLDREDFSWK